MATMKAWRYASTARGIEKNMQLLDIPKWNPEKLPAGYALIEVTDVAVNPADYKVPEIPIVGKLMTGLPATPCNDFSGRVVAVGSSVTNIKPSQLVFGFLPREPTSPKNRCGALAQYLIVQATGCVPIPDGVSPDQASAIGTAGLTAYQAIIPYGKTGESVLIHGGSGGVGTFCIQFAKAVGMNVTAICSTAHAGLCKELGADEIIDYKTSNVLETLKSKGPVFNLVVDNVGKDLTLAKAAAVFSKPGSPFIQTGGNMKALSQGIMLQLLPGFLSGISRPFKLFRMKANPKDFKEIAQMMADGKVRTVIDEVFPFENAPKAFELVKTGHASGKIIIKVS